MDAVFSGFVQNEINENQTTHPLSFLFLGNRKRPRAGRWTYKIDY